MRLVRSSRCISGRILAILSTIVFLGAGLSGATTLQASAASTAPAMYLVPPAGQGGAPTAVYAFGFLPGETVDIIESPYLDVVTTADANGQVVGFTVRSPITGNATIDAIGRTSHVVDAALYGILAGLTAQPTVIVGKPAVLSGRNFGAITSVCLQFDHPAVNHPTMCTGTTDTGDFQLYTGPPPTPFVVPALPAGPHILYAKSATQEASATVIVLPNLTAPLSVKPKDRLKATVTGFPPRVTVHLSLDNPAGPALATTATSSSGTGTLAFLLPSGAAAGNHTIYAELDGNTWATAVINVL